MKALRVFGALLFGGLVGHGEIRVLLFAWFLLALTAFAWERWHSAASLIFGIPQALYWFGMAIKRGN